MEKDLLPLLQRKLQEHKDICKKHGLYFTVTSTYRSQEAQNALYAQGRTTKGNIVTNAKGGQSFHNWRVAYDIVPLVNGKTDFSQEAIFAAIAYFGKQIGLEWGGDFPNIKDMPHFQITLGYTFQDFINNKVDLNKFK
jgi:peptidoglycan L-alanyl-D-glutamate endopeptidase CwlK